MVADNKALAALSFDELRGLLIAELASILQVEESEIDTAKPFEEYGLDSTDAVIVVGLVEERLQTELEPELLLRNRSIDEVLQALQQEGRLAPSPTGSTSETRS
jgi:acyl carrier protein